MNVTGRFEQRHLGKVGALNPGHPEFDYQQSRADNDAPALWPLQDWFSAGAIAKTRSGAGAVGPSVSKRVFDVTVASTIFVALAPGLLIIALLIKLTSAGPVLFWQDRYGLNGRLFKIAKFRTMFVDAGDHSGVRQTKVNDSRVTSIGRLLRRASLDELPQLLNVLRGNMSLVGPRPHVPGMLAGGVLYEELVPEYFDRTKVLPGVTGLAQVSGYRGSTVNADDAKARVALDLAYVDSQTIWLDLRIILATARREFLSGSGI